MQQTFKYLEKKLSSYVFLHIPSSQESPCDFYHASYNFQSKFTLNLEFFYRISRFLIEFPSTFLTLKLQKMLRNSWKVCEKLLRKIFIHYCCDTSFWILTVRFSEQLLREHFCSLTHFSISFSILFVNFLMSSLWTLGKKVLPYPKNKPLHLCHL